MTPRGVSVIIPAYNKRDVLPETLAALEGQGAPGDFELIVVDDGSTDGTLEWLQVISGGSSWPYCYPITILAQANGGPGAARNRGVAAASGDLLLFLDADIVAAPGLLVAHCDAHTRYPASLVMGRVQSWERSASGPAGRIFGKVYDFGDVERPLPPRFGLTQNISITTADFQQCGGFDTSLAWGEDTEFVYRASAGFNPRFHRGQDIEFAYRVEVQGMVLQYVPSALAFHNHPLSVDQVCLKVRKDHRLLVTLFSRYPDILTDLDYLQDKLPIVWGRDPAGLVSRKLCRTALALLPAYLGLRGACGALERLWPSSVLLDFLLWKLVGACQWRGLRDGMREYGWRPSGQR